MLFKIFRVLNLFFWILMTYKYVNCENILKKDLKKMQTLQSEFSLFKRVKVIFFSILFKNRKKATQ